MKKKLSIIISLVLFCGLIFLIWQSGILISASPTNPTKVKSTPPIVVDQSVLKVTPVSPPAIPTLTSKAQQYYFENVVKQGNTVVSISKTPPSQIVVSPSKETKIPPTTAKRKDLVNNVVNKKYTPTVFDTSKREQVVNGLVQSDRALAKKAMYQNQIDADYKVKIDGEKMVLVDAVQKYGNPNDPLYKGMNYADKWATSVAWEMMSYPDNAQKYVDHIRKQTKDATPPSEPAQLNLAIVDGKVRPDWPAWPKDKSLTVNQFKKILEENSKLPVESRSQDLADKLAQSFYTDVQSQLKVSKYLVENYRDALLWVSDNSLDPSLIFKNFTDQMSLEDIKQYLLAINKAPVVPVVREDGKPLSDEELTATELKPVEEGKPLSTTEEIPFDNYKFLSYKNEYGFKDFNDLVLATSLVLADWEDPMATQVFGILFNIPEDLKPVLLKVADEYPLLYIGWVTGTLNEEALDRMRKLMEELSIEQQKQLVASASENKKRLKILFSTSLTIDPSTGKLFYTTEIKKDGQVVGYISFSPAEKIFSGLVTTEFWGKTVTFWANPRTGDVVLETDINKKLAGFFKIETVAISSTGTIGGTFKAFNHLFRYDPTTKSFAIKIKIPKNPLGLVGDIWLDAKGNIIGTVDVKFAGTTGQVYLDRGGRLAFGTEMTKKGISLGAINIDKKGNISATLDLGKSLTSKSFYLSFSRKGIEAITAPVGALWGGPVGITITKNGNLALGAFIPIYGMPIPVGLHVNEKGQPVLSFPGGSWNIGKTFKIKSHDKRPTVQPPPEVDEEGNISLAVIWYQSTHIHLYGKQKVWNRVELTPDQQNQRADVIFKVYQEVLGRAPTVEEFTKWYFYKYPVSGVKICTRKAKYGFRKKCRILTLEEDLRNALKKSLKAKKDVAQYLGVAPVDNLSQALGITGQAIEEGEKGISQ